MIQPGLGENIILAAIAVAIAYYALSPAVALSLLVVGGVGLFLFLRHAHTTFDRLGIPGPKPHPFVGNLFHFYKKGIAQCDVEWFAKYGKVYGSYLGIRPVIVIGDPELLKHVLVKDFHNFTNRTGARIVPERKDALFRNTLVAQEDEKWKWMRGILTPAFTAGKMKHMVPLMERCITGLSELLSETADAKKSFDVNEFFGALSMDVISSCAFAQDVNSIRNPNNDLVKHAKSVFSNGLMVARMMIISWFPIITWRILPKFGVEIMTNDKFFKTLLAKVLSDRRANPSKTVDMLQLLLNANENAEKANGGVETEVDEMIAPESTIEILQQQQQTNGVANGIANGKAPEDHASNGTVKSPKKFRALTEIEIMAQSFIFLVAGYHTTAATLTFCLYELALNQQIQDRCVDEIQKTIESEGSLSYDTVRNKLPYLEAVIWETLRKYPPAPRLDRTSRDDHVIEGLKIPAGATVAAPVYAMHHCSEFYPEPETFNPDRFTSEEKAKRNPYTFLPFGMGPRNCIGMRFALLEIKLALSSILQSFRFLPDERTEKPPLNLQSFGLLKPTNPIWLQVQKRGAVEA